MNQLNILTLPNSRLKKVAYPSYIFNDEVKKLADDILETMYVAPGIGLAATQVDHHIRMAVIDVSENKSQSVGDD